MYILKGGKNMPEKETKKATPVKQESKGNSKTLRLIAIILWVLAIGAEVGALLLFNRAIYDWKLYTALIIDALLVIAGAQCWKAANRINPSHSKSKFVKMIWDQMGVLVAFVAFIPFGILFILNAKNLPKKTKTALIAVLSVLFLGTVGASADFAPTSPEDLEQQVMEEKAALAEQGVDVGDTVYWTTYGKSYHLDPNCFTLARTKPENLHSGTLEEAFANKRTDPCDFCALPEVADAGDTAEDSAE